MLSMFSLLFHAALCSFFFFFNDTATTEIYTLSLHDALPILVCASVFAEMLALWQPDRSAWPAGLDSSTQFTADRKSTRLNSSHGYISYAVFCLKKKKHQLTLPCVPLPVTQSARVTIPFTNSF